MVMNNQKTRDALEPTIEKLIVELTKAQEARKSAQQTIDAICDLFDTLGIHVDHMMYAKNFVWKTEIGDGDA